MSDTGKDIAQALSDAFSSENVEDSNYCTANLVDTTDRMANGLAALANAITNSNVGPGLDANGGTVDSLTEAVMGVTAGLFRIAEAISDLKDD